MNKDFNPAEMTEDFNDNYWKAAAAAVKVKPIIIEVTRYYRPLQDDGVIMSDHGVTVMYTLNYETLTFNARWSICIGDNFNKVTGIQYAQACATPINGTIHPGWALYDEILHELTTINQRYVELVDSTYGRIFTSSEERIKFYDNKRNFALLASEIARSMKQS